MPVSLQRYLCKYAKKNDFDLALVALDNDGYNLVEIYPEIKCSRSNSANSTLLETAISWSSKDFVEELLGHIQTENNGDNVDLILNSLDANGETVLDYVQRMQREIRYKSTKESLQSYMDILKKAGGRFSYELEVKEPNLPN